MIEQLCAQLRTVALAAHQADALRRALPWERRWLGRRTSDWCRTRQGRAR